MKVLFEKTLELALGNGAEGGHLGWTVFRLFGYLFPLLYCEQAFFHMS